MPVVAAVLAFALFCLAMAAVSAAIAHRAERFAAAEQPSPLPAAGRPIADLVAADIAARKAAGIEHYGVPLQAHNGRDALLDAYQEALDLACYLRQALAERDGL